MIVLFEMELVFVKARGHAKACTEQRKYLAWPSPQSLNGQVHEREALEGVRMHSVGVRWRDACVSAPWRGACVLVCFRLFLALWPPVLQERSIRECGDSLRCL